MNGILTGRAEMRPCARSRRLPVVLSGLAILFGAAGQAQTAQQGPVPHPRDVLGFTPGDDYQLADYGQMQEYFRRLDTASGRVRLDVVGKSTEGRDLFVAVITSEENHARIDRYREIAKRLAMARNLTEADARALAREGKAIVWIDNGLHALETAHAQHALLLAHRVATDESEEMRRIRDNVILVLMPCVEADGLDRVADWYRRTVRTPYQDSPMPWWFNKYVSYENNRDYFMQTQVETQVVSRLLYFEWLPQIVYNQHQGFYPSRIFVPPFPDPFNPNIDAGVIRGVDFVGAAMQHRFEQEGKDGVLSRYGFSSWYNGSLRTTTYFHNMIGILSETTHDTPSPFFYDPKNLPAQFGNGWSTREPSTNYPRPWKGGWIHFRDAVDYMLTGSLAVLDVAARYREDFLLRVYQIAARQIELGKTEPPAAYVVPAEQRDPPVAAKFIEVLMRGGVEVDRAGEPFTAGGRTFSAGSYVISLAQPFRPLVKDLLEPQRHPDVRLFPGGPPVPPYDNAGWTLSYQMGVEAVPVDVAVNARLVRVDSFPRAAGTLVGGAARYGYALDPRINNTVTAIERLLTQGYRLERVAAPLVMDGTVWPPGAVVVRSRSGLDGTLRRLAAELGIVARGLAALPAGELREIRRPRIGIYKTYVTEWVDDWTAAEGWTRFVFDQHGIPHDSIVNSAMRAGNLRARFDVVLVPDQAVGDIVGGYRAGRRQFELPHQALPPPEYQGGIGSEGVAALRAFVEQGGTLILVDRACDLSEQLGLPVRNVLAGLKREEFFGPGSIVRATVDSTHQLGLGMPSWSAVYFRKSRAFETSAPAARVVVRYAEQDVLMSGWMVGEPHMAGKAAVVELPVGRGRVVLLGFSPYFRAQPHGTFKLLFNAIY